MNRRHMLKGISAALAAGCGGMIGIPGFRYVVSVLGAQHSPNGLVRRVARLSHLPVARPVPVAIVGQRRDAWMVHPDEVIGRVWLVRETGEEIPAEESVVRAFTSTCPHLGCTIGFDAARGRFECPCHKATFGLTGERLHSAGQNNHAPRDMDSLQCRLVRDEGEDDWWVEVVFERFETGLTTKVRAS